MIRRISRVIIRLLGGLGAGLAIMMMVLAWQLSSGPLSIGFLSTYIGKVVNSEQRAFKFAMDDTILTWAGWDRNLDIRLIGVKVLRQDSTLIGSVPEVSFSLSGEALISGLLAPQSIELFRPRLKISRSHSGIGVGFAGTNKQTKGTSHRLLNQLLAEQDLNNPMSYLKRVEVFNAEITLDDQVLGRSWVAESANVQLKRDKIGLVGVVSLALDIGGRKTEINTSIVYKSATRRIDLATRFSDFSPAVFSSMFYELEPLKAFVLPVNGTIIVGMALDGVLETASFNFSGQRGKIILPGKFAQSLPVEGFTMKGRYEGASGILDLDEMFLDLGSKGSLLIPAKENYRIPLASVRVKGRYLGHAQRLEINTMDLNLQGPSATLNLVAKGFTGIAELGHENISLDIKGSLNDLPINQLSRYWPSKLNGDSRRWALEHLSEGMIHQIRAEGSFLTDDKSIKVITIDGDMDISEVSIKYLSSMPPVRKTNAYIKFDKENFNVFISDGKSNSLNITEATVLISGLDEYDQIANIVVNIDGKFADQLAYLDHKPLEYPSAIGIDSKSIQGEAETELKLNFIVENKLSLDDIQVSSKSRVINLKASKILLGRDIDGGEINIKIDKQGMDVSGLVNIGTMPTALSWRDNFNDEASFRRRYNLKTHISDSTKINKSYLDLFPLANKYIRGGLEVEIDFTILNDFNKRLQVKADITNAELSAPAFGWSKIKGIPGKASVTVEFEGDVISDVPAFSVDAADLKINGKAGFERSDGALKRINFEKIVYGRTNIKGALIPRKEGGWDARFYGASFELTPIWNDIFSKQSEFGTADTLKLPFLTMVIELKRVWVSQKTFLNNISGTLVHEDDLWTTVLLNGELGQDKPFELTIQPSDDGHRDFVMTSADAGQALKVMDFYDEMQGGRMEITGKYNDKVPGRPFIGKMIVSDYQIVDAPFLTRVLSFMSLTGILDELEGGGLKFDYLEVPFIQGLGLLEIKDANASGTSIGFTGSGTIYTYADVLDISGTVVPAYAFNSVLGRLPVIGEILTGGDKGSGVIALNYSMNGSTDEPNITINPLSALTPGIFRNVFDLFKQDKNNTDLKLNGGIR